LSVLRPIRKETQNPADRTQIIIKANPAPK